MRLTDKLLGYLHGVFNKTPAEFVAFRARHFSDAFRYVVSDFVLECFDGDVSLFTANLNNYTLLGLAEFIGNQSGMSVSYHGDDVTRTLSARVLLERSSAQIDSNGDQFIAYSSLLWSYLDSVGESLATARFDIVSALDQMSIKTADDDWLDEWGGYFGIPRISAETDTSYANRIVIEIMRPRGNNKAIEMALLESFGQEASVIDLEKRLITERTYNGSSLHNGLINHDATDDPFYGLFAVAIGYDIEAGGDLLEYAGRVRQFIEQFRDAGTHMESLRLSESVLNDSYPGTMVDAGYSAVVELIGWRGSDRSYDGSRYYDGSFSHDSTVFGDYCDPSQDSDFTSDASLTLSDTSDAALDDGSLDITYTTTYGGLRYYSGMVQYQSGNTVSMTL
jgi:hypothetical protein